ncbi:auxin-responsive protein SAUR66-like [Silene latifolia]|uniref:auxin-responsive protein SAUR66-like n=1 Tax=Silene latifolia TaxID=37657 RepID=UPI003D7740BE
MIGTKKHIKMARKWQRIAIASRKRISWPRPVTDEGYFVVYTTDGRRELLRMAEEEFGIAASEPITLPCESSIMEYIMSMIEKHMAKDLVKALIASLSGCRYSSLVEHQQQNNQHLLISSF